MKTFGKRPFDVSINHFYSRFLSISDKVVAWLVLDAFLMLQQVSKEIDGKLEYGMIDFLVVKIFDQDEKNAFNDFAIDGI